MSKARIAPDRIMHKTLIIASNDFTVREIYVTFFRSCGFVCHGVNCDEKLLSVAGKVRPHVIVSEVTFHSRYYSPYDTEAAFAHLMAIRCRFPGLPVFTLGPADSPEIAKRSAELSMAGHFPFPLDLPKLLDAIRFSLRRLLRRKFYKRFYTGEPLAKSDERPKRGRPPKYSLPPVTEAVPFEMR